jgi:hypothetical protein
MKKNRNMGECQWVTGHTLIRDSQQALLRALVLRQLGDVCFGSINVHKHPRVAVDANIQVAQILEELCSASQTSITIDFLRLNRFRLTLGISDSNGAKDRAFVEFWGI